MKPRAEVGGLNSSPTFAPFALKFRHRQPPNIALDILRHGTNDREA